MLRIVLKDSASVGFLQETVSPPVGTGKLISHTVISLTSKSKLSRHSLRSARTKAESSGRDPRVAGLQTAVPKLYRFPLEDNAPPLSS
mmetsp:Transcript_23062/g.44126  ORF Transcript_23062/g.44126 Transcript_23062/m.44126 type:complete len:88 (-) Transcript_23062:163-426(-)